MWFLFLTVTFLSPIYLPTAAGVTILACNSGQVTSVVQNISWFNRQERMRPELLSLTSQELHNLMPVSLIFMNAMLQTHHFFLIFSSNTSDPFISPCLFKQILLSLEHLSLTICTFTNSNSNVKCLLQEGLVASSLLPEPSGNTVICF